MVEFQSLFNSQHAAILANVGTLIAPATRSNLNGASLPQFVFPRRSTGPNADCHLRCQRPDRLGRTHRRQSAIAGGQQLSMIISHRAIGLLPECHQPARFQRWSWTSAGGLQRLRKSNARFAALQNLLTFDTGVSLIQAASAATTSALQQGRLADALAAGPAWPRSFPTPVSPTSSNRWHRLFRCVGRWDLQRQIFFVSIGGFDTHSDQLAQQDRLFSAEPGHECLLSGHRRNRCSLAGHELHVVGFRTYVRDSTPEPTTPGVGIT